MTLTIDLVICSNLTTNEEQVSVLNGRACFVPQIAKSLQKTFVSAVDVTSMS